MTSSISPRAEQQVANPTGEESLSLTEMLLLPMYMIWIIWVDQSREMIRHIHVVMAECLLPIRVDLIMEEVLLTNMVLVIVISWTIVKMVLITTLTSTSRIMPEIRMVHNQTTMEMAGPSRDTTWVDRETMVRLVLVTFLPPQDQRIQIS